jgi:uncharacterized protein
MAQSLPQSPWLSIIVPVFNEGERIQACLQSLSQVAGNSLYEVIVVDGDAAGSTLQYLSKEKPTLKGVIGPLGRGVQMNAGAKVARGNVLLFLHVDAQLPESAFAQIQSVLAEKEVSGGAFDLAIDATGWVYSLISQVASWRSRLTRIPYGDQAIFLRRSVFEVVGGYPDSLIMEDVALMQKLKRQGYQIRFIRDQVTVSARRWQQEGILRCTMRNWILMTLYLTGVSTERLSRWYRPQSTKLST